MPMTPEQAKDISDMRMKILSNMQKSLPITEGLDKEKLKEALDTVRKERTLGVAGSSKTSKAAAAPVIPLDLDALVAGHKK